MDSDETPRPPPPEAPDSETMEQIRRRRLAKLGGTSSTPSTADGSRSSVVTERTKPLSQDGQGNDKADQARSSVQKSSIPTPSGQAQPNPFSQLGLKATGESTAARTMSPGSAPDTRKRPATEIDTPSTPVLPARKPHVKEESIEEFADRILGQIFRISVDPDKLDDGHGHRHVFLPGLRAELEEQHETPRLSADVLDSAILEAATAWSHEKPLLDYLLPCWKRVMRASKTLRDKTAQKDAVLKEAKRLCMSNCIFALTMPELFGREPNEKHDTLVPYLLRDIDHDDGICLDFFNEAISRIKEDDTILPLFTDAMIKISQDLSTKTMNDGYKPYVNALLAYSKFHVLFDALAQHPDFLLAESAQDLEHRSILGPFFRISPLQTEVTRIYFSAPRTIERNRIKTAQSALQITLAAHQTDLKNIINAFVRASPEARNRTLDWFAKIMNMNHKRRALQVDPNEVSSDGFMMNVTVMLDSLCEPFMDNSFSKIDRVDVDYFRRDPRVDIKDETKLNADQEEADAFYGNKAEGTSNFISEIFFLTLAAHHYGSEATNSKLSSLDRDIKYYQKHILLMESERHKFASRPDQLALFEASLKRHTDVLEKAMSLKMAIEGVLLDEKMQARSLQFMRYAAVWLLRIASQSDYKPDKPIRLPLSGQHPQAFSCLPEYVLQNVLDNLKFVFSYIPQIILSAVGDEIIALCITFLESSDYIRNPHLKSALVTLLYAGTWPSYHLRKGILGDLMTNGKFATEHLLHALMKFYIECESTGAQSQFYDKFNIRYEIFQVVKCVWSNDVYKQQLTQQSKTNRSFFVRFVNLLLNDATYVLDEALSKFPKIHSLEEELAAGQDMSEQDRQKKEEELQQVQGLAKSYMQLANETVSMMKLFTNALSEAFTMPEIVQRLAGMLDYNLDVLAGPKSNQLKVTNPEKYNFQPKILLPELVDIYLNLGGSAAFIEAVATDGRSYKPKNFESTTRILESRGLKDPADLARWNELRRKFATAKELADQADLDFGDVPPEFEDPIMGDLMKDPVILPSRHTVDRTTIIQHLLSDPKDPFTRQPMTIEDVIPDDELRGRIEGWREERLAAAKAKIEAGISDVMDTAE